MPAIYKLVSDLEGYRVGDDGSVCSRWIGGCKPRLGVWWTRLRGHRQASGHVSYEMGRHNQRYGHRLVLEAFVGRCPEGMECCHEDGDPANNRLDNLRWGTPKSNGEDRVRLGEAARGEDAGRAVLKDDDVRMIVRLRNANVPMKDIARQFKVHDRTIQAIMYGRSWNHVTGFPPSRAGRLTSDNHATAGAA